MQSILPIPIWSQRQPEWAGQRLGTVNATTIGSHGCAITCVAMMNAAFDPDNKLTPNVVDDIFTANRGYAWNETGKGNNLLIWNAINRLLPNCGTAGQVFCETTPAPIADLKARLDQGQLAILQVGFKGNPAAMHFVLAVGYNGDDIVFHDPWYGDRASFQSGRYGTGQSKFDILVIHYFGDAIVPVVKPTTPVAPAPVPAPIVWEYQQQVCQVRILEDLRVYGQPTTQSAYHGPYTKGLVIDVAGYVINGESGKWWKDAAGQYFPAANTELFVPIVDKPVEAVENPSELPEWEATWDHKAMPRMVVAIPSAEVVDAVTDEIVTTLPGSELVAPLAGTFRLDGELYVRTQRSFEQNRWYGIRFTDLREFIPPTPPAGAPVDGIQPPAKSPEPVYEEEPDFVDKLEEAYEHYYKTTGAGKIDKHLEIVWGLLLSPLRLLGKLLKGKN